MVDLPSPPTFSKTNPNDQPIMYIALTSDSVTRGQLYDYASTQIGQLRFMLVGVGLMLLMVFRPQGIFGNRREIDLSVRR